MDMPTWQKEAASLNENRRLWDYPNYGDPIPFDQIQHTYLHPLLPCTEERYNITNNLWSVAPKWKDDAKQLLDQKCIAPRAITASYTILTAIAVALVSVWAFIAGCREHRGMLYTTQWFLAVTMGLLLYSLAALYDMGLQVGLQNWLDCPDERCPVEWCPDRYARIIIDEFGGKCWNKKPSFNSNTELTLVKDAILNFAITFVGFIAAIASNIILISRCAWAFHHATVARAKSVARAKRVEVRPASVR